MKKTQDKNSKNLEKIKSRAKNVIHESLKFSGIKKSKNLITNYKKLSFLSFLY